MRYIWRILHFANHYRQMFLYVYWSKKSIRLNRDAVNVRLSIIVLSVFRLRVYLCFIYYKTLDVSLMFLFVGNHPSVTDISWGNPQRTTGSERTGRHPSRRNHQADKRGRVKAFSSTHHRTVDSYPGRPLQLERERSHLGYVGFVAGKGRKSTFIIFCFHYNVSFNPLCARTF